MAAQVQEVPDGLRYHFNVIYNYARSKHSCTDDTELARQVTDHVVEVTERRGFNKSYFYERDCLPGSNLFNELLRVIKLSQYTFLILTPGFVRDCWSRYCQMTAFKLLLDKDRADRLIPVAVDLPEESCPQELTTQSVVWLGRDWRNDTEGWSRVFRVLTEKIPVQQTLQQAVNPHQPVEETPLSPQNSFLSVRNGSQMTSIVGMQDSSLSSHGTRDSVDGPSPGRLGQPPNQFSGHGSGSQDGESFDESSLFGEGTGRSSQGMRQTGQQRRNLALHHLDAGGMQNTGGTGRAEQKSQAANTGTAPPKDTGLTDSGHPARAARGGNSTGRRDSPPALSSSFVRKLELTAESSEEASQVPEATQASLTIHSQHLSSRPRHQHAQPFSQSQVSDLDSHPSIDAPPAGTEPAPPPATLPSATPAPATPLTPVALGGTSSTPGGARGTPPGQREADLVATASTNNGKVTLGPSGVVSPLARGPAAAGVAGKQAGFLGEEETFVKSTAAANQTDDTGFGKSNQANNSSLVPTATVGPTARTQPEGADCGTADARVPEKNANLASMIDDHSRAASSSSIETLSTVKSGTTMQQQENSTASVVKEQEPQNDQDRGTSSVKQALFRTICNFLRPDQPYF